MDQKEAVYPRITNLKNIFSGLFIFWTFVIVFSAIWNIHGLKKMTDDMVMKEARSNFNKDQAVRLWATAHGGVYVPVSSVTPPNPYLKHLPHRDIVTGSGKKLTLMNPAYMLRQMMVQYEELYGVKGHITSLNPLRPENGPDRWETSTLKLFEKGQKEIFTREKLGEDMYFRLMQPMITRQGCLKCHGIQGYKEGQVRGGVSISVPMSDYLFIEQAKIRQTLISHFFFWLSGVCICYLGYRSLTIASKKQQQTEIKLIRSQQTYQSLVEKQTDLVCRFKPSGELTFVNRRYCEFFNKSREELVGHHWNPLPLNEDVAHISQKLNRLSVEKPYVLTENRVKAGNGTIHWMQFSNTAFFDENNIIIELQSVGRDITDLKETQQMLTREKDKLRLALEEVDKLSGLIPICASCKKIRDDKGYWNQIESYIESHSLASFSHSICPGCSKKLYPEFHAADGTE